jgi:hypothetical protein
MRDRTFGLALHRRNWSTTARFLRRMALGVAGVIILLWFVARAERSNSYRGIESSRATGLSAYSNFASWSGTPMLSKGVYPRARLAQAAVLEQGRQIARTASLHISVRDFSASRESVDRIVSAHGGLVTSLSISSPKDSARSLSAQLAIPSAQRDSVLDEFRNLGRVEEENQGSEEVTNQSEDLDVRLRNAREAEERLANILRIGASKVSDVLEVEKEQTRVRGEIETMEAEQKRLKGRVAFASIDLNLTEEYQAHLGIPTSLTGLQIRNAFVEGLHDAADGLVNVVMILLSAGPSLLLWGLILFWPTRWAWRRWRGSKAESIPGV